MFLRYYNPVGLGGKRPWSYTSPEPTASIEAAAAHAKALLVTHECGLYRKVELVDAHGAVIRRWTRFSRF